MRIDVNIEVKKAALDKVLNSSLFKNSALYQKLLTYLIEADLKGETPKEVTIGHDVFNKNINYNAADDTTVRVHMHKLRKKLEQYYQSEGSQDTLRISIPKGHYRVWFNQVDSPPSIHQSRAKDYYLAILAILLSIALIYIVIDKIFAPATNFTFEPIPTNDAIWGQFFNNDYPTTVVIGDFLVFHEYSDRLHRPRRIQDYEINTKEELESYSAANPNKNVENWFLGELPHNSIFNIMDLQPVFITMGQEMNIQFTTEIDIDFIKNRNIIYIGEFKNFRTLSDLVSNLSVKFTTLPWWHGIISYPEKDTLATLKTVHDWGISRYVIDLALVAKLPGLENENYFIIAGFGYNSQIKIIEMLSKKDQLQELEKKIEEINGAIPDYFTMVFEIKGYDRASTAAELKYFREIKKEDYNNARLPDFAK